jgi:HEPN domain-containing protein/predicted nucleotidyltransferase
LLQQEVQQIIQNESSGQSKSGAEGMSGEGLTKPEVIEALKEGLLRTRDDVVAIIPFGSFARGGEYRDVDLLVVVESLDKAPLDRKDEVQAIRQGIDLTLPIEVLLFSKEECADGFRAHLPLFLDIAFEGLVLHDDGFVSQLMEETRRYVETQGIQRTETGGWRFPVAYRQATVLSTFKNRDWAQMWLSDAGQDLAAATSLFEDGIFDKCVTHCQQVTEKAVKSVLACFGILEKTHYVSGTLEKELEGQDVSDWADKMRELTASARDLEPDATLSRYPGVYKGRIWLPRREYTEVKAREALEKARRALDIAMAFAHWWFAW